MLSIFKMSPSYSFNNPLATNAVKVCCLQQNHIWNQAGKNLHALEAVMKGSCWVLLWNYNKSIFSHCQFCQSILKPTSDCQFWNRVYSKLFSKQCDSMTSELWANKEWHWETNDRAGPPVSSVLTKQRTTQVGRARERENVNERTRETWTRHLNLQLKQQTRGPIHQRNSR